MQIIYAPSKNTLLYIGCLKQGAGNWFRVSQLRVLYRVSNWQYGRYDIITDISDANP